MALPEEGFHYFINNNLLTVTAIVEMGCCPVPELLDSFSRSEHYKPIFLQFLTKLYLLATFLNFHMGVTVAMNSTHKCDHTIEESEDLLQHVDVEHLKKHSRQVVRNFQKDLYIAMEQSIKPPIPSSIATHSRSSRHTSSRESSQSSIATKRSTKEGPKLVEEVQ